MDETWQKMDAFSDLNMWAYIRFVFSVFSINSALEIIQV